MAKKEEIILGSGDLYYMEFDGTNIPEDTVLEVEENAQAISGAVHLSNTSRVFMKRRTISSALLKAF